MNHEELIYKIIDRVNDNIYRNVGYICFDEQSFKYGRVIWTSDPIKEGEMMLGGLMMSRGLEIQFLKERKIKVTIFTKEKQSRYSGELLECKFGWFTWHFKTKKLLYKLQKTNRVASMTNVYKQINDVLPGFVDEEFILEANTDS